MIIDQVIENLVKEWSPGGVLEKVRDGKFAPDEGQRFLELLSSIRIDDDACIPKRFLSLIWYLPSFLAWQRERIEEAGGSVAAYDHFVTQVHNTLEDVLGVP